MKTTPIIISFIGIVLLVVGCRPACEEFDTPKTGSYNPGDTVIYYNHSAAFYDTCTWGEYMDCEAFKYLRAGVRCNYDVRYVCKQKLLNANGLMKDYKSLSNTTKLNFKDSTIVNGKWCYFVGINKYENQLETYLYYYWQSPLRVIKVVRREKVNGIITSDSATLVNI